MINIKKSVLHDADYQESIETINHGIGWDYFIEGMGFIAENGKREVVGYVNVKPLDQKTLEISYLAVNKYHQNQGIGTKLFKEAVDLAKWERYSFVSLTCRENKVGAFYQKQADKLGLSLEKRPEGCYPNKEPASYFTFDIGNYFPTLKNFSHYYTF